MAQILMIWMIIGIYFLFSGESVLTSPAFSQGKINWSLVKKVDIFLFLVELPVLCIMGLAFMLVLLGFGFFATPTGVMVSHWLKNTFTTLLKWLDSPIKKN